MQLWEPRARVEDEFQATARTTAGLVALVPVVNHVAGHVEQSRLGVETLADDPLDRLGLGARTTEVAVPDLIPMVPTDPDDALPERVVGCDFLESIIVCYRSFLCYCL